MAVAYVSDVSAADVTDTAAILTLSSVVGSGGNLLIVGVTWRADAGETIVSVLYGLASCTLLVDGVSDEAAGALYYLVNPASTADVVVTFSGNTRSQGTATVLSGANTGAPFTDSDEGTSGAGTSVSLTLTTATGELLVDVLSKRGPNEAITIGADQTEQSAQSSGGASLLHRTSTQDGASGGVMSWTWTTAANAYYAAASVAAAAGGSPVGPLEAGKLIGFGILGGRLVN